MFARRAVFCSLATFSAVATANEPIAVFGHKVPDTDTISAAMIYAWELSERNIPATAYRLGEINLETEWVLKQLHLPQPELLATLTHQRTVAIVDTNNPKELPDDLSKIATLHSIVDHHKLSGLVNAQPLEVDMRPLCSATSILWSRAKAFGLTPHRGIAGLMLAGIMSDSLGFRSPTTTDLDRQHAKELAAFLPDIDVEAFTTGMLEAKANTAHLTAKELVMMDTKVFTFYEHRLRVSVIETTKAAGPIARRKEMVEVMKDIAEEERLQGVLLFVVDILKEHAVFVSSSPFATQLVEAAWDVEVDEDGMAMLPGVLSRKKQMIPKLEEALKKVSMAERDGL